MERFYIVISVVFLIVCFFFDFLKEDTIVFKMRSYGISNVIVFFRRLLGSLLLCLFIERKLRY